jgi:flavin-dependent dehydrogenase
MARESFDAVVVGGGPAGASAATGLAKNGRRVLVLESEKFPRFHIGESLLPLGDKVFCELGVADKIVAAGFVQKFGAQLLTAAGDHCVLFDFRQATHVDPPWTFQVHRAELDQLLLEHAVACGAELRTGRATDYCIDGSGATVEWTDAGGAAHEARAQVLIDASGRTGFVARREGVRVVDEQLKKAAVYAHFRGVPVDPGARAGDTRIIALPKLGWVWIIPLKGGVTSVGAVLDLADYQQRAKGDLAALFAGALAQAPAASRLLEHAECLGDFRVESGFSYRASRYCGDRWLLAGDSGSFLDPIFSTGVLMALRSGLEAAHAAELGWLQALARPALAQRRYHRALHHRYWFVRRFVTGFYEASTRDMFFAPRPTFGLQRAVTTVLAGGFDLGLADRLRLQLFFLLGRLQRRFDLAPRVSEPAPGAVVERP